MGNLKGIRVCFGTFQGVSVAVDVNDLGFNSVAVRVWQGWKFLQGCTLSLLFLELCFLGLFRADSANGKTNRDTLHARGFIIFKTAI